MSEIKDKDNKNHSALANQLYERVLKAEEKKAKQSYEEIQKAARRKGLEYQEAKRSASDSTGVIKRYVNDSKAYVVNFSDLHSPEGNLLAFMENLKKFAAIPNCYFVFGGDQINNSIKGSVGDTHGEIMTPRDQVRLIADIIKEVAIDYPNIIDRIWSIISGNHENRTYKDISEDPAYWLAEELGITDRYFKNIAVVEINVVKEKDGEIRAKNKKGLTQKQIKDQLKKLNNQYEIEKFLKEYQIDTAVTKMLATHAEQVSGNPAAQSDHALSSAIDASIDLVTYGHSHNFVIANDVLQTINSRGTKNEKHRTFVNFGSYSHTTEYAERALYPLQKQSGTNVIRIANIGSNSNIIDVLDAKNLLPEYAQERIETVIKEFQDLSKYPFSTKSELDKAYTQAIKKAYRDSTVSFKKDKEIKEEYYNRNTIPTDIYFAPLSGAHVGKDDNKDALKQLKKAVDILSKIDDGVSITLTDLVFYKKALTITNKNGNLLGEKFPEESFSYILQAAEILKPVKDKIITYFNGEQEEKIMRFHSEALAKMAVNRLQMDDSLCFEPYDEEKLLTEQIKIQSQQVEGYNKQVLGKEVERAYKDIEKAIKDSLPYMVKEYDEMSDEEQYETYEKISKKYYSLPDGVEYTASGKAKYNAKNNARLDYLKKVLSYKLRAERKLLSMSEDKVLIDHKFPLADIELRKPHKHLIQNIFAHVIGIEPKQILPNNTPNLSKTFVLQVQDERGRTRNVIFSGSSFKSRAGRRGIHNYIQADGKRLTGAHVYYTNTKSGKEFVTMNVKKDGKKVIDNVFISAGGIGANDKGESTANKIYKISVRSPKNVKSKSRGIYANLEKDFDILCESLNYETAMLQDDIFSKAIKNVSKTSYDQAHEALKEREKEQEQVVFHTTLDQIFEDIDHKETIKAKPRQIKTTKKSKTSQTSKTDKELA